ncbi:MAG: biotin--[acetyl-CoA-carboxylase] ligase [Defluviitaleaceae bacterium]|nr:biotin--[acetyl-CoA-carboxylase] ligase [Defluviitaleaceae bacterium]
MKTKEKILAILEANRGKNISGEAIAQQIGVSRNAVWKAVNALKKDGRKITAATKKRAEHASKFEDPSERELRRFEDAVSRQTKKGYCLCDDGDTLSAAGMSPFLQNGAEKIFVFPVLESTNKTAKEMAISDAAHGTVVFANAQTAGRGRYGRSFFSPPSRGIYMSFILRPEKLGFHAPTLVTSFAAVAVCESIETICNKSPKIKWVNDIFLDEKKICGISAEAIFDLESAEIQWVVVGVGVNFSGADFPEELREIAGAIFCDKPAVTRNRLAAEIINRMLSENPNNAEILQKYKRRMKMLGEKILVTGNEPFEAVALDIDDGGRLIVRKNDGEVVTLSAGEVRILL